MPQRCVVRKNYVTGKLSSLRRRTEIREVSATATGLLSQARLNSSSVSMIQLQRPRAALCRCYEPTRAVPELQEPPVGRRATRRYAPRGGSVMAISWTAEETDILRRAYQANLSVSGGWHRAVSKQLGRSHTTVANKAHRLGLTNTHRQDPRSLEERLWPKVDQREPDECWPWLGTHTPEGYGRFVLGPGSVAQAHRVVYEQLVGSIPEELVIDHLCRNHECVNPAHMEPVTNRENCLRGFSPLAEAARRTICINGHPYTPGNTYIRPDGLRGCRACRTAARGRWLLRHASHG